MARGNCVGRLQCCRRSYGRSINKFYWKLFLAIRWKKSFFLAVCGTLDRSVNCSFAARGLEDVCHGQLYSVIKQHVELKHNHLNWLESNTEMCLLWIWFWLFTLELSLIASCSMKLPRSATPPGFGWVEAEKCQKSAKPQRFIWACRTHLSLQRSDSLI